jgi:hypothetical protein
MANRLFNPNDQYLDDVPEVYAGGSLTFYVTATTTPATTYSDSSLAVPNSNPVDLDSAGRPLTEIFLDPAVTYKVILKDSAGATIWTRDPVVDPAANVTAIFTVYAGNPNGNVAGSAGTVGGTGASVVWDITNDLLYVCTTSGVAAAAVWTQVGASLGGQLAVTGDITPASLSADQDNYAPTGYATASVIRQNCSADVIITGLAGGAEGVVMDIHNVSTANTITLADGAIITTSTAANRFTFGGNSITLHPNQSIELWYDSTTSRWRQKGMHPMLPMPWPGGRLTLESGVPVSSTEQIDKTTIYYTAHIHGFVPIFNGTNWYLAPFSELSQTLADNTKSPAAAAINSLYDMFVWNNAGTLRLSRGPAWSSATARGTGAGTTELERKNGILTNKVAITNGPTANRGLYVGTIATDGSGANGELNMMFAPAPAAGGSANRLDVWNMYNRVRVCSISRDSTNTWNYTTATVRAANNSASNRVTAVFGLSEDAVAARYATSATNSSAGVLVSCGVGRDLTNAFSGVPGRLGTIYQSSLSGHDIGTPPGIGSRFFQACEWSESAGVTTWYGDGGDATLTQMALTLDAMM